MVLMIFCCRIIFPSYLLLSVGWQRSLFLLELDVHKGLDPRATNRASVVLHADDLTAPLAEAQVAARQHDGVLDDSEANDALTLGVVRLGCRRGVLLSIHVRQLEDCLVVLLSYKGRVSGARCTLTSSFCLMSLNLKVLSASAANAPQEN